ncbi:MAG: LptA/OstA family protein [Nitrospiraceae bacterium]
MFVWMLFLLLNAAIGFSAPAPSSAQASVPKGRSAEEAPTTITSKTMTVSNHENKAIFEGEVVLTRGPLTVHSDHMVVSFHPSSNGVDPKPAVAPKNAATGGKATKKEQAGGSEAMPAVSDRTISMIEATGRVEIQKEDGRATCQKAIYYEVERKIVLTGQPVAWQKGTRVSGKRITMFLDEDRSLVEGDSQVTIEGEGSGKR